MTDGDNSNSVGARDGGYLPTLPYPVERESPTSDSEPPLSSMAGLPLRPSCATDERPSPASCRVCRILRNARKFLWVNNAAQLRH